MPFVALAKKKGGAGGCSARNTYSLSPVGLREKGPNERRDTKANSSLFSEKQHSVVQGRENGWRATISGEVTTVDTSVVYYKGEACCVRAQGARNASLRPLLDPRRPPKVELKSTIQSGLDDLRILHFFGARSAHGPQKSSSLSRVSFFLRLDLPLSFYGAKTESVLIRRGSHFFFRKFGLC